MSMWAGFLLHLSHEYTLEQGVGQRGVPVCSFFATYVPRRIRSTEIEFQYIDVSSSVFFWGQMDSMTPNETLLSIRLPVKALHSVKAGIFAPQEHSARRRSSWSNNGEILAEVRSLSPASSI